MVMHSSSACLDSSVTDESYMDEMRAWQTNFRPGTLVIFAFKYVLTTISLT